MADKLKLSALTQAPLRNRVRVQLGAPIAEVWALIGDLSKFPEYSAGLERVEVESDANGRCVAYTCHFKPMAPGEDGPVSREMIRWWEPGVGFASSGASGDAFGLSNDVNLVTVKPSGQGSLLTWEEYFDAADVDMMQAHFDEALADIASNLASRFGGRIVERFPQELAATA